jgi:orotidine-5'-phosphate decarboxylase
VAERRSQIVLGIDPDPSRLWPADGAAAAGAGGDRVAGAAADGPPVSEAGVPGSDSAQAVARAVTAHCRALIDATAQACVAVKLQLARFEVLGPPGAVCLRDVAAHARAAGLLVIADGKRGDIDVTATAYAAALTDGIDTAAGHVRGLEADLVTVNPLMGRDAIAPFVAAARARAGGVLVLVRTSNPGAADIEDLKLAGGGSVWERIADLVAELGREGTGAAGLSDVGAVFGATAPAHLERARELMPRAPFLLPGVGAQGGRVEELAAAFAPGPAGGLVSASRSIADAHVASGGPPPAAARAEAERLRELAWKLSASATSTRP